MTIDYESGKRGSNSRPIAWKAIALPTELLPLLLQHFKITLSIYFPIAIGNALLPLFRHSFSAGKQRPTFVFQRLFSNATALDNKWGEQDSNL
jgi:hypothetical protein